MGSRKRLENEILREEEQRIMSFCLAELVPEQGHRLFLQEAFERYEEWLIERGLPETLLTIGGFGRLFPRGYQRRVIYKKGVTSRGLVDVRLRSNA